ncbi:Pr6Pr family membrane protein [Nocardioides sp.]|uniref:Pr6Pr family membrane protein n=1 Tax=Nocardioides sp. TaxID=35761 RepID=UPI002631129C|nr:Pr6Pr family membrane protein [Nocardioides sp.]
MTSGEDVRVSRAWAVVAVVAWFGVVATVLLSGLGWYAQVPPEPGLYGDTGDGAYGVLQRVVDTFSYFTIWSNIVVAVTATLLARGSDGPRTRVLLLDALLMITVTGIVYQLLLAPSIDVQGWSLLTDPVLHVVTPLLTLAVWAWAGPRGWLTVRLLPLSLVVPLLWVVWMLARGAVIDAYPYAFVAANERGYPAALATIAAILVFGLVVAAVLTAVDRVLSRRRAVQPA